MKILLFHMVKFLRLPAVIFLLFSCCSYAGAQAIYRVDTLTAVLHYRQNAESYDPHYLDNNVRLQAFVDSVAVLRESDISTVVSITGTVGASINGIVFDERFLCQKRISNFSSLLSRKLQMPSNCFKFENAGQNWKRLEKCVEEAQNVRHRDDALEIIRNPINRYFSGDTLSDARIYKLMKLDRGQVWPELDRRFSGEMDVVELRCIYRYQDIPNSHPDEHALLAHIPQRTGCPDSAAFYRKYLKERRFHMAVRTNLLYDLALVPNIGVDVAIGKRFSVSATWEYAYWTLDSKNIIHKVYGGDASFRWWFGRDRERQPLTRHHLGPYGQMAAFDFAYGEQRWSAIPWQWAVGLEYGYTLPLKNRRIAFDFTIGAGYANVYYNHWHITSNGAGEKYYEWDQQHKCRYIGPTKAEISLIWLIGGNRDQKKNNR